MTKLKLFFPIVLLLSTILISCKKDDPEVVINKTSIIPATNFDRPNVHLGCVEISSRTTTIKAWDHEAIDGDIVSIIANGNVIIDKHTLDGPGNKISVDYEFDYNGFNYITLFAHNEGDRPPNTCAISINGVEYILEANLLTNGSIDIIVGGYGVSCNED